MSERKQGDEKDQPLHMNVDLGLGGLLGGLAGMVDKLADLAKRAEDASQSGEAEGLGKELKGVYGFNVRVGLGGEGMKVEPFGTVRKERPGRQAEVSEIREPMVDLFDEEDHLLIVAEMPGVGADDVHLDLKEDVLTLSAERGDRRYQKEVLLPRSFEREKMTVSCNNGMVEVKCAK